MNWIFLEGVGRMLSQPSSPQFPSALWIWCYSTKLIILQRVFVPNEILLKVWRQEKFQIRNACVLPPPAPWGDGNYHTWYLLVSKTNGMIAARIWPHECRELRIKQLSICRLCRHRWPQVRTTSNKCVKATLRFVCVPHRGQVLMMLWI